LLLAQYGGRSNLRPSGIRYHDWIMEALTWRVLNAARLVTVCSVDANATSAPPIPPYVKREKSPSKGEEAPGKPRALKQTVDMRAAQAVNEIAARAATARKPQAAKPSRQAAKPRQTYTTLHNPTTLDNPRQP
jgi:hypothetical protein